MRIRNYSLFSNYVIFLYLMIGAFVVIKGLTREKDGQGQIMNGLRSSRDTIIVTSVVIIPASYSFTTVGII